MSDVYDLIPIVTNLIDEHGNLSVPIKNALSTHLTKVKGRKVSNTEANRLLTTMVDQKLLFRVSYGKHLYYSTDPEENLSSIVGVDCRAHYFASVQSPSAEAATETIVSHIM